LRKTIDVDASNFQAYGMLGRLYLSQKRLGEALKEFDELAKRQPRPVQAHTLAGIILEAQGNSAEAKKRTNRRWRSIRRCPSQRITWPG
jgi:Flp pilus assembly protein TadD